MDGVLEEVNGRSFEALSQERDNLIMGLLELLSHRAKAEPVAASGLRLMTRSRYPIFTVTGIKPQYLKCVQTTRSYGPKTRQLNI